MAYQPTLEDFEMVDKMSSQGQPGFLERAGNVADTINKYVEASRLPQIAGGLLQGTIQGAESIANIPLAGISKLTGKDVTLPYVDFQKYTPQDPTSRAAFLGGDILGTLLPGAGAYKGASELLSKIAKPSLATEALAGTSSGYAVGGSDDDRTRYLSALLGGAIPSLRALRPKTIAKRVTTRKQNLEDFYQSEYQDLFDSLKQSGLHDDKLNVPSIFKSNEGKDQINNLFANNRKFQKSINRFQENPTFENAHEAQSDLRKISSKLEADVKRARRNETPVPSETTRNIQLANSLRKRLRGNMQQFLIDKNAPDILQRYTNITRGYRDELAPYFNPDIAKYEQGRIRPKKLMKELIKDEGFMRPKGAYKDIPGLGTRRYIEDSHLGDLLVKALQGAGLGIGASAAYQLGAPYLGRTLSEIKE